MAFFYNQAPFDEKHQKRLFVIHMEDVSRFSLAAVVGMSSSSGIDPSNTHNLPLLTTFLRS